MNLTCDRRALHHALTTVRGALEERATLPVLKNVLIDAGTDSARLAASNLELAIEHQIAAAAQPGSVTLPLTKLAELVAAMSEDEVTLALEARNVVRATSGSATYTVMGLAAEEFPPLPEVAAKLAISVSQRAFHRALRYVLPCLSEDATRPVLTGVLLETKGDVLRIVTTDTHRIAARALSIGTEVPPRAIVVPGDAMKQLLPALDQGTDELADVVVDDNQIRFTVGPTRITSRLLEGQFPKYERIIPTSHNYRVTVAREPLQRALKRAGIVCREGTGGVAFEADEGRVSLSAQSGTFGTAQEEMPATVEGGLIRALFNWRYLASAVETAETETVTLELSAPVAPVVVRCEDAQWHVTVVMPLNPEAIGAVG